MINQQFLDSICFILHQQFPDAKLYTEKIAQGFKRPCFFLESHIQEKPLMTPRFEQLYKLTIQAYIPAKTSNARTKMNEISNQILDALSWVDFGSNLKQFHVMNIEFHDDDYLEISGNYCFHIFRKEHVDKMQTLKHNFNV